MPSKDNLQVTTRENKTYAEDTPPEIDWIVCACGNAQQILYCQPIVTCRCGRAYKLKQETANAK